MTVDGVVQRYLIVTRDDGTDSTCVYALDQNLNVINALKIKFTETGTPFTIFPTDMIWDEQNSRYVMVGFDNVNSGFEYWMVYFDPNGNVIRYYGINPGATRFAQNCEIKISGDKYITVYDQRVDAFARNNNAPLWSRVVLYSGDQNYKVQLHDLCIDDMNNIYPVGHYTDRNRQEFLTLARIDNNGNDAYSMTYPLPFNTNIGFYPNTLNCDFNPLNLNIAIAFSFNENNQQVLAPMYINRDTPNNNLIRAEYPEQNDRGFTPVDIKCVPNTESVLINGLYTNSSYTYSFMTKLNNDLMLDFNRRYSANFNSTGPNALSMIFFTQLIYNGLMDNYSNFGFYGREDQYCYGFYFSDATMNLERSCQNMVFKSRMRELRLEPRAIKIDKKENRITEYKRTSRVRVSPYIEDICPEFFPIRNAKEIITNDNNVLYELSNNQIIFNSSLKGAQFSIMDITGSLAMNAKAEGTVDISNLSSGVYLLMITKEDGENVFGKISIVK
jgi:hypothetical protein